MNGRKPSRELSVETVLSLAFNLYRSKFLQFFLPFLISGLITGIFSYVIGAAFPVPEPPDIPTNPDTTFISDVLVPYFFTFISAMVAVIVLSGIVALIMNTIVYGVATKNVSDHIEKGSSDLGVSINYTTSKLPTLLAAQIIAGILIAVGFLLFIVPGIIVAIMFSLVIPTIVVEQRGILESLGRSKKLVSRRWGTTFLLILISGLILGIPVGMVNYLTSSFIIIHPIVNSLIPSIITAFLGPIIPIAITYYYYSMVARENPPQQPAF